MSVVGGTQGYVSGQVIFVSKDVRCDNHPNVMATKRVVGDVDNFGYEASDFCDECFEIYSKMKDVQNKECDWCGLSCNHFRPVSFVIDAKDVSIDKVCDTCLGKHNHQIIEGIQSDEDQDNDHGVECHNDREDNDYCFDLKENTSTPLNFNNPVGRW